MVNSPVVFCEIIFLAVSIFNDKLVDTSPEAKMGRPAAAHAAWPQRRGCGLSLVTGRPRDFKFAAFDEGAFFSSRGLRQMLAKYYFNNPTHATLPQSSKASCLGIVSLEAHSQVAAAALCLCLSPGNDGVHMVHPLAWPTQLRGSPASQQRAGRWSPWTPEKGR